MDNYIKIYSHPRSGTHFLEAFLAKNFYKNKDLSSTGEIYYGHWSNKILLKEGEPYHKLFGSHFFPEDIKINSKSIFIYRDGRAAIASIWNSKFYNKAWNGISFSEFLRKDIDWYGGLGQEKYPKMNIVQHWYLHTLKWVELNDKNLLYIRFEDLKTNPDKVYLEIAKKFFPMKFYKTKILGISNLDPIKKKVGISPNKANIDSWKNLFNKEDLDFFYSQLPSIRFLYEL